MTGQELAQAAALKGAPVHAVVRELYCDRRNDLARRTRDNAWASLHRDCRMSLVSMHTTRENIENAAAMAWSAFTPEEQLAMGIAYRQWVKGAALAGCLR